MSASNHGKYQKLKLNIVPSKDDKQVSHSINSNYSIDLKAQDSSMAKT